MNIYYGKQRKKMTKLERLSGLTPDELAGVLEDNPRAYMAVKGAVAEEHLKKYFIELGNNGHITQFKTAQSDFDKDFYVTMPDEREFAIECKNVEVIKVNSRKSDYYGYFRYLQLTRNILTDFSFEDESAFSVKDLDKIFKTLPQSLRESGIPRYEYSASKLTQRSINGSLTDEEYINQFSSHPLTIDFQRTRNSGNKGGIKGNPRTNRFYRVEEIDIVAACLFSRTMHWEFVFGSKQSLIIHSKYKTHYSNRLVLNPKLWRSNFLDVIQ